MHPALRSWRNDLPPNIVRLLAYLGAIALLSMASAHFSQSPKVMGAITPVHQPEWIDIERPFAAFALSIPEAADVPASYAIRRHGVGNGRKDILTLGEPDGTAPLLRVEIYRPGNEIGRYADPVAEMILSADALGPVEIQNLEKPLATKFGPLTLVPFVASKGTNQRSVHCSLRRNSIAAIAASAIRSLRQRRSIICSGKRWRIVRKRGAAGAEYLNKNHGS